MPTFMLRANELSGQLGLIVQLFPPGGAIANGAGSALTESSGLFSATIAENLSGYHDYFIYQSGIPIYRGFVYCVGSVWYADVPMDSAEIASDVYARLAGGRSTLLSGPTSAGGPVDQVKTVDLSLTIPLTIPATSELLWFMRCHPDASTAYLVASKSVGLTQLMTSTSPTANLASITRNADNVAVKIKAAALSQLPSETVACELREVTQSSDTLSRYEAEITLRHSAGR